MILSEELVAQIFVIVFVLVIVIGIIYAIASKKSRSGYKPINSVTFFGATSQFQSTVQKAATEHILEVQADKKMEEEESGDPQKK